MFRYKLVFLATLLFSIGCKDKMEGDNSTLKPEEEKQVVTNSYADSIPTLEDRLSSQGINFYARGHEPEWSLDMDFESNFHFKAEDGKEMYVPSVQGDKAMDANVTRFYAEVEKGTLIISIQKQDCQDSMADKTFNFSVRVQFKYGVDEDFKEYSGCGDFLPDLSLHDIWVLEEVNGEPLSLRAEQERPRFEFFSKKRRNFRTRWMQ